MALIGQGAMSYRAAQQAVENPLYQLNHFGINVRVRTRDNAGARQHAGFGHDPAVCLKF
jgi:hypothetical protein